ncbi:hypothetical protein RUM44_008663 [Polyplax serrata]|uniref:Uncharacterized protein n=1 Tax=Polyplax serrata TaxID=468196 RepID=A0ABR1BD03_POLSC
MQYQLASLWGNEIFPRDPHHQGWFPCLNVNNATARVQTKKPPTLPNASALRGVGIQHAQVRAAFPSAATLAAAGLVRPTLSHAAAAAATLHGFTPVYYDTFLAAQAADPSYRLQAAAAAAAASPLLKTPLSTQAQQASYAAAASYTAVAARAYGAAAAAAAAQPVAGYAAVTGYGRDFADPYLASHGIGPVAGYGAAVYRSGYNRFAPY